MLSRHLPCSAPFSLVVCLQKACAKVFQTKRAAFDSKAQAVPDEAKALAAKAAMQERAAAKGTKRGAAAAAAAAAAASWGDDRPVGGAAGGKDSTAWKAKSSQLRDAMRADRLYKKAIAEGKTGADLPPPAPSAPDPSLVPCPTCGRSFNSTAAERHIPKCATIKAKVSVYWWEPEPQRVHAACSIPPSVLQQARLRHPRTFIFACSVAHELTTVSAHFSVHFAANCSASRSWHCSWRRWRC